eukprot:g69279.t1
MPQYRTRNGRRQSPRIKEQLFRRYIVRILVWLLWQKGFSSRRIASDERVVPLTDRWVRKWMRRFEEGHGHAPVEELVLDLPRSGRPPKATKAIKKMIVKHVYLKDYRSTTEAAKWLRTKGVIISKDTIQRFPQSQGFVSLPPQKSSESDRRPKKRRNPKNNVIWAMNADKVPPVEVAQGAGKLSVWVGISVHGKTDLQFYKGSPNAHAYQKILKKGKPSMRKCFPEQDWTFMHDGASAHKAATINRRL